MRYEIPEEPWDEVCKGCDVWLRRSKPLRQIDDPIPLCRKKVATEATVCLVALAVILACFFLMYEAIEWLIMAILGA